MPYFQQEVTGALADRVKWFWMVEDEANVMDEQKIIPDGYPEVIFHFGDPYEVNITGKWERQSMSLLAGQLTSYFYLRNTGRSKMFAIKLQPWVLHDLFDIPAGDLLDRIIPFRDPTPLVWKRIQEKAVGQLSFDDKCAVVSQLLMDFSVASSSLIQQVIRKIIEVNGLLTVQELCDEFGISERTLERQFKLHVGLSPKRYCRIIRHAYVFRVVQDQRDNWAQVAYQAGFYDQTHFIKNFQEFTGEGPTRYGFDEDNLANFFLK